MKIWVATNTVKQPTNTVSGRFGSSLMFVGYERLLNQWYWLQPKGVREKIAEPPEIFVEKSWARKNKLKTPRPILGQSNRIRRSKGPQQLEFGL